MYYRTKICGHDVYYVFRYPIAEYDLGGQMEKVEFYDGETVEVSQAALERYTDRFGYNENLSEYMACMDVTTNYLLQFDCAAFHSVAISVNGKGYLIAAESGVGKSTQYLNLMKLHPDEIKIINGDKPFLEFGKDHIMIYPSPWNGKEGFGSDLVCQLDGIIFLEQADTNEIMKMKPEDCVIRSIRQFLYFPENKEIIHKICDLDRDLLKRIPLWLLRNKGDLDSSELLYKTVLYDGGEINE